VIDGFGGAFTEAAGYLYANLNDTLREAVIQAYFSRDQGIGYTLGRVPLGSCDFAVQPSVSYAMRVNDTSLESFSLEPDLAWKIPFIRDAQTAVNKQALKRRARQDEPHASAGAASQLRLVGSPWSAPAWMKSNNQMICDLWSILADCRLKDEAQPAFAAYLARTAAEYAALGLPLRWLTPQNEPGVKPFTYEGMVMTGAEQAVFLADHLGPALQALDQDARPGVLVYDWNKNNGTFVSFVQAIYANPTAAGFTEGVAVHWYDGDNFDSLDTVQALDTSKRLLATEATAGYDDMAGSGGSWGTGEHYLHDILGDLNHHVTGFVHWNLMLTADGGPLHVGPIVGLPIYGSDAPMIVNTGHNITTTPVAHGSTLVAASVARALGSADAGLLSGSPASPTGATTGAPGLEPQVSFWYVGHVSWYVLPGSTRIGWEAQDMPSTLEVAAFELPSSAGVVIVAMNKANVSQPLHIWDPHLGLGANTTLPPRSAQTIRYA
jgi:glucosylceramidase